MRFNLRRVGVAILIAATFLLGHGASAFAAGAPTIRLTPDVNLRNNEVIRISGTGFTPGAEVEFAMCASAGHCDIEVGGTVFITAAGTFPVTRLKVHRTWRWSWLWNEQGDLEYLLHGASLVLGGDNTQ